MNTWKEAALKYKRQGMKLKDIVEKIEEEFDCENYYGRVQRFLHRELNKPKLEKRVSIQNQEPEHYEGKWDGTETIRFAIIGDTQIGSKYTQLTYLHNFYDICAKEEIKDVYHTGDLTEGLKMRALRNAFFYCANPILRILLTPAGLGKLQRIFFCHDILNPACFIHQQQLCRRCTQVDSYIQHALASFNQTSDSPPYPSPK